MEDTHLTVELLEALTTEELPPPVLSYVTWKHLMALCPDCKEAVDEWLAKEQSRGHGQLFGEGVEASEDAEREQKALERKISRELAELRRTPVGERLQKVKRARKRFRHPLLIERLFAVARRHLHGEPSEAVHFAQLAVLVAARCQTSARQAYRVLSLAKLGNALRASGSLSEADATFREVRRLMRGAEVLSSDVHAEVDCLEGSLRKDRGDFEEARKLLARSSLVYRTLGQDQDAARALLTLAYVHFRLGQEGEALEAIQRAILMIDPEESLELAFAARQNLASALCDTGDPAGALQVLQESRDLFQRYFAERDAPPKTVHLITWLEGRIARGLEEFTQAETKLRQAAEGYGELGIGYDTALVCLDLAETYLAQGKHDEVAELAKKTEYLLSANDLTREATTALLLFQRSAGQRLLSAEVIRRVRQRIEEHGLKRGSATPGAP